MGGLICGPCFCGPITGVEFVASFIFHDGLSRLVDARNVR